MAKRISNRKRFGLWPHQRQIGVLVALLLAFCVLTIGVVLWAVNSVYFLTHR